MAYENNDCVSIRWIIFYYVRISIWGEGDNGWAKLESNNKGYGVESLRIANYQKKIGSNDLRGTVINVSDIAI